MNELNIHESAENYLEAILALGEKGPVRSIARPPPPRRPTPRGRRAPRLRRAGGAVVMDQGGFLTLTGEGLEIARRIYERHLLLTKWLVHLGVPEKTAANDACLIEHDLSVESFEALKNHIYRDMGTSG